MKPSRGPLTAWGVVAAGWVIYGFGIAPGYYSWGQFLPQTLQDLELSRAEGGLVFGVFTLFYSCLAPLVGLAIGRWGLRATITAGSLVAALGYALLSRADSLADCLLAYSLLAGAGIGFGTILPVQTLANNWFRRYRATALAILMTAGGIVGKFVPAFDQWMLQQPGGWRTGWLVIAGISVAVAAVAALFVRNAPEDVGLRPDGARGEPAEPAAARSGEAATASPNAAPGPPDPLAALDAWTVRQVVRTPQFVALCLCGVAYAVPWGVVVAHGALHLRDRGFDGALVASVIGWMVLVSIAGRLAGFVGDLLPPARTLGIALLLEAAGITLFYLSSSAATSLAGAVLLGIGFGGAYVSMSACFGAFFGRRAFATTSGVRMMLTGVANAAMPPLAGWAYDTAGSYALPFLGIAVVGALGGFVALVLRPPVAPQPAGASAL